MNNWVTGIAVTVISMAIFLSTSSQREVARRELERQDALIERERISLEALFEARAKQANDLIEKAQAEVRR